MNGQLFGDTRPAKETETYGHRTTPAKVVQTLHSLPEFQAHRGPTLDLGCGDGAIWLELARLDGDRWVDWDLVDIRECKAAPGVDGRPTPRRHRFNAARPWPARVAWVLIGQVVANPPWSRQWCGRCGQTWASGDLTHCRACSSYSGRRLTARVEGQDLAQAMVAQSMASCTDADVWVVHTTDWRFHGERSRFFLGCGNKRCTRPASHGLAGITDIAERVAYGDPSKRKAVKPHNKMTSLYHFAPMGRCPAMSTFRMIESL